MSEIAETATRVEPQRENEAVENEGHFDGSLSREEKPTEENTEFLTNYEQFKLSLSGKLIFFTLAVLTLMVSLDGTSISVALPVRPFPSI